MLLALALACVTNTRLESGSWALWSVTVEGERLDEVPGVVLTLDVEANEALFTLGSETLARPLFRFRAEEDWVEDCSGNFSGQRLEAVDLEMDALTLGDLEVSDPVLLAGCSLKDGVGRDGVHIRPGPVGEAEACGAGTCLDFEDPARVAA
jgi:hypothetical protein